MTSESQSLATPITWWTLQTVSRLNGATTWPPRDIITASMLAVNIPPSLRVADIVNEETGGLHVFASLRLDRSETC